MQPLPFKKQSAFILFQTFWDRSNRPFLPLRANMTSVAMSPQMSGTLPENSELGTDISEDLYHFEAYTDTSQNDSLYNFDPNSGSEALITKAMFTQLLSTLSSERYNVIRKRIAFLFLYHLGLRVGLLQIITVKHVRNLVAGKSVGMGVLPQTAGLIKRRNSTNPRRTTPCSLVLSEAALKQFEMNKSGIDILIGNKTSDDPLFTTEKRPADLIHVTTLTKELNSTLRQNHDALYAVKYGIKESSASVKVQKPISRSVLKSSPVKTEAKPKTKSPPTPKTTFTETQPKLTTHSFRVNFAQKALATSSIQDVQLVLGHKSVVSTYGYDSHKTIKGQDDKLKKLRSVYEKCQD